MSIINRSKIDAVITAYNTNTPCFDGKVRALNKRELLDILVNLHRYDNTSNILFSTKDGKYNFERFVERALNY